MKNATIPKSWRNGVYINQVPELMEEERKGRRNRFYHNHRSPFIKCSHFICTDRTSMSLTTGIIFPNGRVYVGDDVWRMSNRADYCEYPFKKYKNRQSAELDYDFKEAERTFLTSADNSKEGGRHP